MHRRYLDMIRDVGAGARYEEWRGKVVEIARRERATLWDFADDARIATVPLAGSNPFFIDANHFTPMIGRSILRRLNFPVRADRLAADDRRLLQLGRPLVP
jgi:hypothetical protein